MKHHEITSFGHQKHPRPAPFQPFAPTPPRCRGEVTWSRQGIVSFDASAPDYFDELCLCAERGQSANITAKSTVVIWRLHRAALRGDEEPCRQAEELTREVDLLTQARRKSLEAILVGVGRF